MEGNKKEDGQEEKTGGKGRKNEEGRRTQESKIIEEESYLDDDADDGEVDEDDSEGGWRLTISQPDSLEGFHVLVKTGVDAFLLFASQRSAMRIAVEIDIRCCIPSP